MREDLARHLAEERVLALKMVEEGRGRDVGGGGDLLDRGGVEALGHEELLRLLVDAGAELALFALATAFDGNLG